MKIIFLNTWHAGAKKELYGFLRNHSSSADIFCLGEVSQEMFDDFKEIFVNFNGQYVVNTPKSGQSTFINKKIEQVSYNKFYLFEQVERDSGSFVKIHIKTDSKNLLIGSVEGKVRPGNKLDTDIRINQSKSIIESFSNSEFPKIIMGDFNLLPETESIRMFEKAGYRNLIKQFEIKSTRNRLTWENLKDEPGFVKQYFADYCFVSPDIKVKSFKAPNIEISDHNPLILEFDL